MTRGQMRVWLMGVGLLIVHLFLVGLVLLMVAA